jgi:pyruvate dehydrogenase kinase 2/3/4
MLVSRISRRVLAEHHLALSASYSSRPDQNSVTDTSRHPDNVGIIYTNLCVKSSIEHCVNLLKSRPYHIIDPEKEPMENGEYRIDGWPDIIIDGHEDTRFSYIKEHLDYIVFELLKNVRLPPVHPKQTKATMVGIALYH